MSTVHVEISTDEQAAAGLDSPEITYTNADAQVREEGRLVIHRQEHVLAEYPADRYLTWEVIDDEDEKPDDEAGDGEERNDV